MGVAVLPPQDFLRNHHLNHNKPRPNPNPNPNPNTIRSSRRRRNSPPPRPNTPPVMGPIRILKRDEDLSPPAQPKPKPNPGPIPDGFYAGSAFVTSPPPSSLPLPAFFTGRRNCGMCEARDPVAETVLRRALKLQ